MMRNIFEKSKQKLKKLIGKKCITPLQAAGYRIYGKKKFEVYRRKQRGIQP